MGGDENDYFNYVPIWEPFFVQDERDNIIAGGAYLPNDPRSNGRIYGTRGTPQGEPDRNRRTDERTAEAYAAWVYEAYSTDIRVSEFVNFQIDFWNTFFQDFQR